MANSENVVPGAGPGSVLAVPLYEEQDDIHVAKGLVDQDASTYEWTGPQEITLGPDFPAADGVDVRVYRQTEDDALPAILDPEEGFDFQGANANWQRVLFLIQELKDRGGVASIEDVLALLSAAVNDATVAKNASVAAKDTSVSASGAAADSALDAANSALSAAESAEDAVNLVDTTVRFDTAQSKTPTEKKQARENSGARGNLFKVTVVLASDPAFAFDTLSKYAEVELYGGGGAGGGAVGTTPSGSVNIGAGGGGGGRCYKFHEILTTTAAITIAASAEGNSGASGSGGNSSTYVAGAVSLTASGGGGGGVASVTATGGVTNGANGGSATGGDLNTAGGAGGLGWGMGTGDIAVPIALPGRGGAPPGGSFVRGLIMRQAGAGQLAGINAGRSGGGGGGVSVNAGTAVAGGNGGQGYAIIKEYY